MSLGRIDTCLTRLSHLSQVGILALAVFGYFFTVRPFYQKALLDEEVAQKALELKALSTELEQMYEEVRNRAVANVVLYAGMDCSGYLVDPPPLPAIESLVTGKPYKPIPKKEMLPTSDDFVMHSSLEDCLGKYTEGWFTQALRPRDKQFLSERMQALGRDIDAVRVELLPAYESGSYDERAVLANEVTERLKNELLKLKEVGWY